uniref:Homeobox domain-containing protein n=1 Tax=Globodera rostochiensis TaxID=31243 RepID=A0A914HUG0_GLORO
MDSPTSEASFDFVDTLVAERGGGTLEIEENGGDELGAADQQGQIKSGQLLENVVVLQHQTLLKMEEYQKQQRHNQTEICVQIGELEKLVGPAAASALTERRADIDQALRANVAATEKEHRKLLIDHEALRAEVAEMKRLQKMQEQRQAQMLLRLDELCKAFTGGSVLLERVNLFVDLAADLKELKQFIMKTVKEGTEGGTEAVKEGTEGGTETTKEGTEGGTEAVKEGSEGGTEAVKEGTEDGTEAVKKRTEGRVFLSQQKVQMLERAFAEMKFPSVSDCKNLAQSFCLTPLLVKFWFQNRRAKHFRELREQEMMRGRRMDGEVAGEGVRSGRSMGPEGIGSAESEDPSPLPIAGMRTVKEGTDGTEAVKKRSEGGTEAVKERSEGGTEAAKEGSDGTEAVKERSEGGTEAVKERSEGGTEAAKEGSDGTEAVKERSEGGTEAVKERSEGGTEAAKEGSDGTEAVKERSEGGTEAVKERSEGGTEAVKERSEGGTEAAKEGSDGTEAVKERSEGGTEAVKERSEGGTEAAKEGSDGGTEAIKEGSDGTEAVKERSEGASPMDMKLKHNPFGTLDSTLFNSGHFITSCNGYHPMPFFNQAYSVPYGQMHASAAPFGQMHASAASFGQMHASAAPFGQMHASAASFGQMHASAAPFGQMHASAAPFGQMHASAAPFGQMHASAAPFGQMHASAAPFGQMHASAAPHPQMPSPFYAAGMNGAATAFDKKSTF